MKALRLHSLLPILASITTLLSLSSAYAQINYQGRLTDSNGSPLANGQKEITFHLFNEATGDSPPLWGPFTATATIIDGRFNTVIGPLDTGENDLTNTLSDLGTLGTPHLQITVDGVAILPRQRILAAPRALLADHATTAGSVGQPGSNAISINANLVGIGTADPEARLHVYNGESGYESNEAADLVVEDNAHAFIQLKPLPSHQAGLFFAGGQGDASESGHGSIRYMPDGSMEFRNGGNQTRMEIDGSNGALISNGSNQRNPPENGFNGGSGQRVILQPGSSTTTPSGFGIDSGVLWSVVPQNSNHRWYVGTEEKMVLTHEGNVGIGTSNPTEAKLEVNGGTHVASMTGAYLYTSGAFPAVGHGAKQVSIKTSDTIWCGAYVIASSDERIKSRSRRSNSAEDLQTLLQLEVTDYQFKDTIAHGSTPQKKLIAQQVKEVYPQAVSLHTNVIPDIYQQAQIENGWIHLATELKPGERVRLIGESEEGIYEVIEAKPDQFRIDFKSDGDRVFVYGREVEDFHTLDYDAIAMLNVSATQELKKEMDAKVRTLSEENETLKAKLANLERSMGALTRLVENLSPTSVPVLAER